MMEYAGKLGPWARGGCKGTRYLDMGLQGRPDYRRILQVEPEGGKWYWLEVRLEDGRRVVRWCGCNTYEVALCEVGGMMDKPPMELYLQTHDDDGDEVGEITFCHDQVYRCDTRYVRADVVADLLDALQRMADLDSQCDYTDELLPPEQCPGIEQSGGWCHWCQMRAAIAKAEEQSQ